MSSVAEHYDSLLADIYSWMFGGFDQGIANNAAFFERHDVRPRRSGVAIDLGAGCGFQAIPLARRGFRVTAIDLDRKLLAELDRQRGAARVKTVAGDLLCFDEFLDGPVELVICMTDTLLHLGTEADVAQLFAKVYAALEPGGRFIATFRDLSAPLEGLDRFIPVRSDDTTILCCFLEYETATVKVHDLVYRRTGSGWQLAKSFYRKLRLSADRTRQLLEAAGFGTLQSTVDNGLMTMVAQR
jgi:SAM-dependent methyltransferase